GDAGSLTPAMKRSRAARLRRARLTVTFISFRGSIRPSRTAFGSPGVTLRVARGFDRAGAALAVSTVDPPMATATSKLTVRCLSLMPPPKIARHHTEIALPPQDLAYKSNKRKRRTGWVPDPGGGGGGGPSRGVAGDGAGARCGATVSERAYLIRPVP